MANRYTYFIIFLLSIGQCFAGGMIIDSYQFESGGVGCTTANETLQYQPTTQGANNAINTAWAFNKIVLSVEKTITSYRMRICNNTNGTIIGIIFNNNPTPDPDEPDQTSPVANSSVDYDITGVIACDGLDSEIITLDLAAPIVLSAGTYWLGDDTGTAGRNVWYNTSTGDTAASSGDSGANWSIFTDTAYDMEVWGCEN